MKTGLVSVTFRQLDCETVVKLCRENNLRFVEWGGDIHVPAGDLQKARAAADLCRQSGVIPDGYGSYYNAADPFETFLPALEAADALGARYIRIWAGRGKEYDRSAEERIRTAVRAAEKRGIAVSLECHRDTMTEDPALALRLAQNTGCLLHFQPNPDVEFERNLQTVSDFAPYLCAVHVFAWEKGNVRFPLRAQSEQWTAYANASPDVPFLLEFVCKNDPDNLKDDAETLREIGGGLNENRA